jgi:hypothetical protein
VLSAPVRELWRFRYVRPDAATSLDSRGWTFRRRLLEGLKHAVEVAAHGGHVQVVGAKGRPAARQRPLILFSCTFPARLAVGTHATEPRARHRLGHLPGPPSNMDTLAWPAGRRERTPRRTAAAADRMPDAFRWSSAVVHPCGLAGEYE